MRTIILITLLVRLLKLFTYVNLNSKKPFSLIGTFLMPSRYETVSRSGVTLKTSFCTLSSAVRIAYKAIVELYQSRSRYLIRVSLAYIRI